MYKNKEEIDEIKKLADDLNQLGCKTEVVAEIAGEPIHSFVWGASAPEAPTLFVVGGVHGLERIGCQLVIELLKIVSHWVNWDESFYNMLERMRIVMVPALNPHGLIQNTRSNLHGVDLMRNAPIDARDKASFLVGGHRISPRLPWYRGESLQEESKALIDTFKKHCFASEYCFSLDCHSGFGYVDRLWYPYAGSYRSFPHRHQVNHFKKHFDQTYPAHVYCVEPQHLTYITHGDLWDYIYEEFRQANPQAIYLPFTLEMGSWIWIKKNPFQIFSKLGIFDPVRPHRRKRVFRRHIPLFDFLLRSVYSWRRFYGLKSSDLSLKEQVDDPITSRAR